MNGEVLLTMAQKIHGEESSEKILNYFGGTSQFEKLALKHEHHMNRFLFFLC